MTSCLFGALTGLCVVAAFVCGCLFSTRLKTEKNAVATAEELTEEQREERERLIAEQQAFRRQMNYNASDVYFHDTSEG